MSFRMLALATATTLALTSCSGAQPSTSGGTAGSPPGRDGVASGTPSPGSTDEHHAIVVASDLEVPWGLDFLPDGAALVTLRDSGKVLRLQPGAPPRPVGTVPGVAAEGEGGLLGIAVSPHFGSDRRIFVYLTAEDDNRVLRMTLRGGRLVPDRAILTGIPKAAVHNGGRIAFGPDGFLYLGTGDGGDGSHAQDRQSLGGKVLRIDQDGQVPPGNPFDDSPVWSLGHRNVQGLAWDSAGRMYASEFGQDTWDELNRIEPGKNYGWPVVEGKGDREGYVDPLVQWPTSDASPSGIAIGPDHAVYLAALRGESLWRVPLDDQGGAGKPERLLHGTYGRLRTVVTAPDDRLWLVTSNTFRGTPRPGDDQVLILPKSFPPDD
jgi:glucose/arabinose dehydrogenase